MSAALSLRAVCALADVPGFSPGGTALALAIARELGSTINGLGQLNDNELIRKFSWNTSQVRAFRAGISVPIERFQCLANRGIRVSTVLDDHRPAWSLELPATPWFFYRGDLTILNNPAIGFSGSRDASDHALDLTRSVTIGAVEQGMTVISGGARGVDMAAHVAALDAGGTTVVIVPQGLDTWRVPTPIAQVANRALVISMDLPWAEWATISAMQRNRAIVDLSEVIVIPQAGTTGGSHRTGLYALGRKRGLWIGDLSNSEPGNQLLLQRGAMLLPWLNARPDIALMRTPKPVELSQQSLF